jgi:hypothetical protein
MFSRNCNEFVCGHSFSVWTFCIAREGVTRFWVIVYIITPCNDGYIVWKRFSYPRYSCYLDCTLE